MEGFGRRCGHRGNGRRFWLAWLAFYAIRHRKQHLARVLEVTPPQQCAALAGEAIGIVGRDEVIDDDYARGGRRPALRAPARRARLAALSPVNDRVSAHARARYCVSY